MTAPISRIALSTGGGDAPGLNAVIRAATLAARHRGCKVLMYGCGIGPVRRGFNRQLTRRILDRYVDTITLREEHSLEELRSFGVKRPKVIVASDPALSLSPAPAEEVTR